MDTLLRIKNGARPGRPMSDPRPKDHTPIGVWGLPSGNSCDVSISFDEDGVIHVWYGWDVYPLTLDDHAYYLSVVVPEVIDRIEHLGHPVQFLLT